MPDCDLCAEPTPLGTTSAAAGAGPLPGALARAHDLLVTAEQVGVIREYMALARLLSPIIVVIEDVDLSARDRGELQTPERAADARRLEASDVDSALRELLFEGGSLNAKLLGARV